MDAERIGGHWGRDLWVDTGEGMGEDGKNRGLLEGTVGMGVTV